MNPARAAVPILLGLALVLAAGCQTRWSKPLPVSEPGEGGYQVRSVGERFLTEVGYVVVIRVDDEYRLIVTNEADRPRGDYRTVFSIKRDDVQWSEWMHVEEVQGLKLAFLSPTEFAVRYERVSPLPR